MNRELIREKKKTTSINMTEEDFDNMMRKTIEYKMDRNDL